MVQPFVHKPTITWGEERREEERRGGEKMVQNK